jgi:hemerythrin
MCADTDTRLAEDALHPWLQPSPLFTWQPEYSVKIGVIDEHHKRLLALVNELHDAMRQQKGRAVLAATLNELICYTQAHFSAEEVLMEAFGYPESLQHRIEHDRLTRTVLEFQQQFMRGQVHISAQLMEFLKSWLVQHILGSDQKYVEFFAERGAER